MTLLNRNLLKHKRLSSGTVSRGPAGRLPEKIVQFGEGNFLRAFADWMIDELNSKGSYASNVVAVQPIRQGLADAINAQEGVYTVLMRGIQNEKTVDVRRIVTSISRALNPFDSWGELVELFHSRALRVAISNTTEAGIVYAAEPHRPGICPESFPAKVAALLYERYQKFRGAPDRGLIFLPCELIDRNGDNLRKTVLTHAEAWGLPADFGTWVRECNFFLNTLVDRIVPGYPKEEAAAINASLGYEDRLLVAAELFHLWVIEGPAHLSHEIPLADSGLNVVWTDDMAPYRTRKVRVLNGAHTCSVLAAYGAGLDTVRAMVEDPVFGPLLRRTVFEEILPGLALPQAEKEAYAASVLERFSNPFIRHELLSISLNSVSKWKVRVLPSLLDYQAANGSLPAGLAFSLAALIAFYNGRRAAPGATELRGTRAGQTYPIRDDAAVLTFFEAAWTQAEANQDWDGLATAVLGRQDFWGRDLNAVKDLTSTVSELLRDIAARGLRDVAADLNAEPVAQ